MKIVISSNIDPETDSFVRGIYASARNMMERSGHVRAVVFFEIPNPYGHVAFDVEGMMDNKDAVAGLIRGTVRRLRATSVLTLMEAWMINILVDDKDTKVDPEKGEYEGTPPAEREDRQEVLLVSLMCSNDPGTFSASIPITRDANGEPSLPEAVPPLEYVINRGRFGNPWF